MAMQMGAGDKKSASEIVSNCFRILLILGFALTCVFCCFDGNFYGGLEPVKQLFLMH